MKITLLAFDLFYKSVFQHPNLNAERRVNNLCKILDWSWQIDILIIIINVYCISSTVQLTAAAVGARTSLRSAGSTCKCLPAEAAESQTPESPERQNKCMAMHRGISIKAAVTSKL